jgi:hypothetical protein
MTLELISNISDTLHNGLRQLPLHNRPFLKPCLQLIEKRHQCIDLRDDAVLFVLKV